MSEKTIVVQVLATLDEGGAESMIMNVYRNIDREKIQFDFVVNEREREYSFEKEIKQMGGRIFFVPKYIFFNHFLYRKAWHKLVSKHLEWKILHIHHTSVALMFLDIAKKKKIFTIAHSHTAGGKNSLKSKIKIFMRYPIRYLADELFACSKLAANWMFGNRSKAAYIINNAVNTEKLLFNEVKRLGKRKELNLENKFVIGHIGNFSAPKNYPFILEIMKEVCAKKKNVILLLVGKKENNPSIEHTVAKLGLAKNVIFTGVRNDVPDLLQAMDVFLFPSLFEGLPVTLIEAQASGLKCIIADTITEEVKITDLVEFISLNEAPKYWAQRLLQYADGYERKNTYEEICNAGYDVKDKAMWLQEFYLKNSRK